MGDYMDFNEEDNELTDGATVPSGISYKKILCFSGLYLSLLAIAVFAAQYTISFLFAFISGMISKDLTQYGWFNVVLTAIAMAGVGFPLFALLMKKLPASKRGEVRNLSFGQFIGYFIVCVGAAYISNMIGSFINSIIGLLNWVEVVNPLEDFILNSDILVALLYASIVAPIVEELIFRKILLDKLRRFGDLPAILITGIAFGLFHMNLPQFLYAAVLGILFAYITIRTNRIIYSILLHMMLNFIGTGIVPILVANESVLGMGFLVIWVFGTMTIGSLLVIINAKKIVLAKPIVPLVEKKDYIFNPGAIIFITICLAVIVIGLIV
jgi:membrane protease YdiL (CAAX protease family)